MARVRVWVGQIAILLGSLAAILAISILVVQSCTSVGRQVVDPARKSLEISLRELVLAQLAMDPRYQVIDNPKVEKVLEAIVDRLAPQIKPGLKWPVRIKLVKNSDANALTLPGGAILVFTGLLKDAAKAEEVAAVIAHELGHLQNDDPINALERNIAISVLLSIGTGSYSPQTIEQIIQVLTESAFSRSVEARADAFALELLAKSRIRPGHLADFFKTLIKTPLEKALGKQLSWIGSHPDTDSRIKAAEAADAAFAGPEETLEIDWDQVQEMLRRG